MFFVDRIASLHKFISYALTKLKSRVHTLAHVTAATNASEAKVIQWHRVGEKKTGARPRGGSVMENWKHLMSEKASRSLEMI